MMKRPRETDVHARHVLSIGSTYAMFATIECVRYMAAICEKLYDSRTLDNVMRRVIGADGRVIAIDINGVPSTVVDVTTSLLHIKSRSILEKTWTLNTLVDCFF